MWNADMCFSLVPLNNTGAIIQAALISALQGIDVTLTCFHQVIKTYFNFYTDSQEKITQILQQNSTVLNFLICNILAGWLIHNMKEWSFSSQKMFSKSKMVMPEQEFKRKITMGTHSNYFCAKPTFYGRCMTSLLIWFSSAMSKYALWLRLWKVL